MTLKEQTIKRIEAQKEKIEEHKKEYGRVGLFDKLELKYLESVLKDIEVLGIFERMFDKENIAFSMLELKQYENGNCAIISQCEDAIEVITKEEYKKVKEWLENDR